MVNRRRPSHETPLGLRVKKDGCFRRLHLTSLKSTMHNKSDNFTLSKDVSDIQNMYLYVSELQQLGSTAAHHGFII